MVYATEVIQNYRLALMHQWNFHFWADQSARNWNSVKLFDELKGPLFSSLVGHRINPEPANYTTIFGEAFKVVPKLGTEYSGSIGSLYVDIGFSDRPGQCWDLVTGPFKQPGLGLVLLDLFDWVQLDWRYFRYYLVRIEAFDSHANMNGREGLVDSTEVDVLWDPPGPLCVPHINDQ